MGTVGVFRGNTANYIITITILYYINSQMYQSRGLAPA